jgi:hypothetical protein
LQELVVLGEEVDVHSNHLCLQEQVHSELAFDLNEAEVLVQD